MGFLLLSGSNSVASVATTTPVVAVVPSYSVTLTAYNAVPGQTDSDPLVTASGAYSNPEIIAARSVDLRDELPFGTVIELDGPVGTQNTCGYGSVEKLIGYRVIADSMNPRYTERIDVLFDTASNFIRPNGATMNAGNILGICKGVTIRVVGKIDMKHIPKTQVELAKLVTGTSEALAVK
ncbi:MAG: hypothetical protein JWN18_466 [Parcubacteria group bacterium]|nr:hypothetical protein [Parcubacteria group bacterium]